ncbi:MAG: AAA family ATPase [Lachnospiraceae bacterium]|nr:AAA family ATPase [Lachnospiraceae bacterium]
MEHGTIVNIGEQRFDRLRETGRFYIDKTDFIREWWEKGSTVTLITRPRRFGKTLNMSMIECFFSNKYPGRDDLFEGLSIWKEETYRALQGTIPVIFMSFAGVKTGDVEEMKTVVKQLITEIYAQYKDIMKSEIFDDADREAFWSVDREMDDASAYMALKSLCIYLQKYYGKNVIIILDEYDTPMQEAWLAGTWEQAAAFFRKFFNHTFKSNAQLCRGVITGITRISKESIFSDLNNLDVITVTSNKYAAAFGFTEEEVFQALDDSGLGKEKQKVKAWYDGFIFGSCKDIYNPWSIASFIEQKGKYKAYWANTSENGLVNSLVQRGNAGMKQTMEELLQGKSFRTELEEQVVFEQLEDDNNAVWSLLLATGYLKALNTASEEGEDDVWYTLALTNFEVQRMFRRMIKGWFRGSAQTASDEFIKALMDDNVQMMNLFMNKVALHTFSYFDSGNKPSGETEPERFYHGFVLGMMVNLADVYHIRSNRESGYGRYDVMLEPFDKSGKAFIFEFKVLNSYEDERTLADVLVHAHAQIEKMKYETELLAKGFGPEQIRKYGFAFQGKHCLIG